MFNLILFGAPGSGKGTQSLKIAEKFNLKHLSTGDLLRHEISSETALGKEAKEFIDKGLLVPDAVVIGMISKAIESNKTVRGFLFDGFPRTEAQAEALDKLLKLYESSINLVLALEVSEDELVERLLLRGKTSGRSDDANEEIIRERIKEYRKKTAIVADYYENNGVVRNIAGEGTVDNIFEHISQAINEELEVAS
ncbi:adenylate kinase [Arachidicoccus rhizosphaerae]|uniref:Adenylate kinase n=1 Tax=Arachidicoccus rhizosphaerae TaxID=551991 RepID=A0A1H3ZKX8_9BACT|nr:adenylate kinase [Arachidicoccus rhizosphaerae]SEA24429.1 adenylate kinase [Arachidicoccus rhizosphaerae]